MLNGKTAREWMEENRGRFVDQAGMIAGWKAEAGREPGGHEYKVAREVFGRSAKSGPVRQQRYEQQKQVGMSRDEARMQFDVPARITAALNEFVGKMEPGQFYTDSEAMQACRVSIKNESEYWDMVTSLPQYVKLHGVTENGTRLWAAEDDLHWAETDPQGITGFRRSIHATR